MEPAENVRGMLCSLPMYIKLQDRACRNVITAWDRLFWVGEVLGRLIQGNVTSRLNATMVKYVVEGSI